MSDDKKNENDPFNLEQLRLSQNFSEKIGVKKALTNVPVRKPHKQHFIQAHPEPDWRIETAVLILKDGGEETYLVGANMIDELSHEIVPVILQTAINRQGDPFLWPLRLPGEDGKQNPWHRSALDAAHLAMKKWVRVQANLSLGSYDVYEASGSLPEPEWPDTDFQTLIRIAFKDRMIESSDHPVVRQLRGQS